MDDQSELRVEYHPALESYLTVAFSFVQGLLRLTRAKAAHFRLLSAISSFRESGCVGLDSPGRGALSHLAKIEYASFDSYKYVTDLSHLIYATSLLDTFLSETTLFLFLLHPLSMGT